MKLKRDVVQLKREMNATSSQDEFAKWAKLRRRHDKTLEEYEAKSTFRSTGKRLYTKCPTTWEIYILNKGGDWS